MAEETVSAIVLRRTDSGESDRRLTILTRELGKLDVIAKGARKSGSRLAGASDPLSMSTMTFAAGKRTRYVTQVQPQSSLPGLRRDFLRLTLALALAEVVAMSAPYDEIAPERFDHLVRALVHIEHADRPETAWAWAETRALLDAGFFPEFGACVVTGGPVDPGEPWFSERAGGLLAENVEGFGDRRRVPREVVVALEKMALREEPPPALRRAPEVASFLLTHWESVLERPRPAGRVALAEVRVSSGGRPAPP